jgi:hypothetical protein
MKTFSDKRCRETPNTSFMLNNFLYNRAFYEITWKNIVELGRSQMTICRIRIEFWIPKATNTHTV